MDTLLITALTTLVAELGDRTQLLLVVLTLRYRADLAVFAGFFLATVINTALSAFAGTLIADLIDGRSLMMFQGLAIVFAAGAMLWPRRPLDALDGWKIGPFFTALLGCLILEFGDKSQFIVMAASARADDMLLAGIGGVIGVTVAGAIGMALGRKLVDGEPFRWVRRIGGALFALFGATLMVQAITG